jgi:hypothetical protein
MESIYIITGKNQYKKHLQWPFFMYIMAINQSRRGEKPLYNAVGSRLIEAAVLKSKEEECKGRIGLHSLPTHIEIRHAVKSRKAVEQMPPFCAIHAPDDYVALRDSSHDFSRDEVGCDRQDFLIEAHPGNGACASCGRFSKVNYSPTSGGEM